MARAPVARAAIVGGRAAPPGELRAVASWDGGCSGVLVGPRSVLIALHCIDRPPGEVPADAIGTTVAIGNPNGGGHRQSRVVNAVAIAPQAFSQLRYSPDLAILVLNRPSAIPPVRLPASAAEAQALQAPGSPMIVAGFGVASYPPAGASLSPVLAEAGLGVQACTIVAPQVSPKSRHFYVCATPAPSPVLDGAPGGTGCVGDSGGPGLTSLGSGIVLLGVVSGSDGPGACAPGSPVVFAAVSSAYRWLHDQLHHRLPRPDPEPTGCRRRRRELAALDRALRHRPGRHASRRKRNRYALERVRAAALRVQIFDRC